MAAETPTKPTRQAKAEPKAEKPKPKEETKPTPTPTPTKEEAKTTQNHSPKTKPAPRIKPITWEKFAKFGQKSKTRKKAWIKEALERAKNEPIQIRGLTRAQIAILIAQVNKHNLTQEPKIAIKYNTRKGTVMLAPTTPKQLKTT